MGPTGPDGTGGTSNNILDLSTLDAYINDCSKVRIDVTGEILKVYREQNINSEMAKHKLIFVMFCVGMEVLAVRVLGVDNLRGLSQYMCGKMPNFIEFMHFMATENIGDIEESEKDANFHYRKILQTLVLEFIVFITAAMCSNGTLIKSDILDKISDITINDVKTSPSDNVVGYLASMVSGAFIGAKEENNAPDAHL